jgi:hypothetical protein
MKTLNPKARFLGILELVAANISSATEPRSASANHCAENIWIHSIVIAELKLGNVQRKIFVADFVKSADNAALKDRPKAFNRVCVNCADNVLAAMMVNGRMWIRLIQTAIAVPSVRRQQTDFVGYGLMYEFNSSLLRDLFQNARNDVALALHSANDGRLSRTSAAAATALFVPMAIIVLAANPRFINLDNAAKFLFGLYHRGADFVAHTVRSLVGAEPHLPLNLKRANSFLAGRHQMHDLEPVAQRLVGVLKDRVDENREPIAIRSALLALPVPFARMQVIDGRVATTRTVDALRPAAALQIGFAGIFVTDRESCLKFPLRHLVNWLRTFCHGGHPFNLSVRGYCHA